MSQSFAIDSLKLSIKYSKVKILNDELKQHWIDAKISSSTGEIIYLDADTGKKTTFKKRAFSVEKNGIKTKYILERRPGSKTKELYVSILFNSKILKHKYFEGINNNNIQSVYDRLMSQNVIYVSMADFLDGLCTDIDIKKDLNISDIPTMLKQLKANTKEVKDKRGGCNLFLRRTNKGIEWGSRKTATPKYPYIKFYDKATELKAHSQEFFNYYRPELPFGDNTLRVEYTIKGKKHLKSFNAVKCLINNKLKRYYLNSDKDFNNTLIWLLRLSDFEKSSFLYSILNKHLKLNFFEDNMKNQQRTTTNYNDSILIAFMEYYFSNNPEGDLYGLLMLIYEHFPADNSNKVIQAKSRMRAKVNRVYEEYLNRTEEQQVQDNLMLDLFDQLGISIPPAADEEDDI